MRRICLVAICLIAASCVSYSKPPQYNNLHLLDSNVTGFSVFRSGQPKAADIARWCELGISEVFALNGMAKRYQQAIKEHCPSIKVVYNTVQNSHAPLQQDFLTLFDSWIAEAKKLQKKVVFHCTCGCHRAGRLAAYYELKYLNQSFTEVHARMLARGKDMDHHKYLYGQVEALEDYARKKPCRYAQKPDQAKNFCVRS